MNIAVVVVTYNRLSLLKECVEALAQQTVKVSEVIIMDNNSNDGTKEYLLSLDAPFRAVLLPENIGGAGGFSEGIKEACKGRPDWIWLMDDDTIPQADCLEKMLPYTEDVRVGFINSLALWSDGSEHVMNKCGLHKQADVIGKLENLSPQTYDITKSGSFVSMLLRGDIPFKLGLPYKEFFIWCDDYEYSTRITDAGYIGIWAKDSIALHKTATNYSGGPRNCTASQAWKLYYGNRNESFCRRKKNFLAFSLSQLNRIRLHRRWIKKRRLPKEEEQELLKHDMRGLWDGIFFNPKIEYLK